MGFSAKLTLRVIAGICSTALAVPAIAQSTAYAVGQGSPNQLQLSIPVTASVGGRCGFKAGAEPSGSYNQPNFDVNGLSRDFPFELECTGPSRVGVVSTNGGLKTAGTVPTGYATLAPYAVQLNLVGSTATATATCPAAQLVSGQACSFLGPATTTAGLRLGVASLGQSGSFLRVSAPAYAGSSILVDGNYSDVLTVTASASL